MQTAFELPQPLYERAERAARSRGISVAEFITGALEERLRTEGPPRSRGQRVRLPLVPSAQPGTRQLSSDRVAELLSEDDVSR